MLRISVMILAGIGTMLWLWVAGTALIIDAYQMGEGIAYVFGALSTLLFLVFTLPALILALKNRALWTALVLAIVPLISLLIFL
ncbi:hypothetical protein [Microvirga sp. TS319]|uniref:hypothetical protein n=1 Tax=Microvirga sp. TS319 TaxID=3241165 RepID=UPI00351A234D